jgi:putative flippase GtrA
VRLEPYERAAPEPVLDVVIPVYNEEAELERSVRRLHAHLACAFPYPFQITIADNASTDATLPIAEALQAALDHVRAVHLDEKGRGRALQAAWGSSRADVLAYMDVDLSTDLAALLPLVAPLVSGHSDIAIGSRLARGSRVVRGPKRELISRSYNLILRRTLAARFSDAQCGFKAIRSDVARRLLPMIEDTGWFFDTELLVLAERSGLRIAEVPVDWVDDPDSRVDIVATAVADLRGIARLLRAFAKGTIPIDTVRAQFGRRPLTEPEVVGVPPGLFGHLVRFASIGVVSTVAYLVLFLLFRNAVDAQPANLLALLVTAVVNTAANRRLTFGVEGRTGIRAHAQGLAVFAVGLALTSGALGLLHSHDARPTRPVELGVLIAASAVATLVRFVAFRRWIFPQRSRNS